MPTKRAPKSTKKGFTAEERAAMRERSKELKGQDGAAELLQKLSEMPDADRALGERVHAIVTETAPELEPRTWYGMPAYAKDGKVVLHFKGAFKFKSRYATLGFSDRANLDDGAMWATEFALLELTPDVEQRIAELVKTAVG
jgi:uncharacterized protein YdhG (YjbR/CyaY superfamily)